ncbi:unnamed protein product [Bursaphelenchus okinawaensis]|uniref:Uncharacterized protein n=1 Tax=Bursaphelenchus okinawaensis TaxID=465554 RepID=A0A811LUY0_9BILA|nr:unnamed protein product [Bursaphelenchus okinawaensis]CAG9127813.1 unnamed protein product [Bursaphelenchus okinawaensis]
MNQSQENLVGDDDIRHLKQCCKAAVKKDTLTPHVAQDVARRHSYEHRTKEKSPTKPQSPVSPNTLQSKMFELDSTSFTCNEAKRSRVDPTSYGFSKTTDIKMNYKSDHVYDGPENDAKPMYEENSF